ncbi:MAG TPA: FaeA/PapI family transcriptional regulator [Solirubrobacteraceae bacterium]|jgi:hypothetical protein|nr:FaeA/PapI family transcriptional regulator [Solirubrobacteraceae bacterium]
MLSHTDLEIIDWIARLGAAAAEDVMRHFGLTAGQARHHLAACTRAGMLGRCRLLCDRPALFVARRAGLTLVGRSELAPARVSVASYEHWRACALVALELETEHPGAVLSDRELRVREREVGRAIASAELGLLRRTGEPAIHRPDLAVCDGDDWPRAIEVEIAVKAPRRLQAIVRAWARTRSISGVTYYASPRAARAVARAVAAMYAEDVVDIRPLPAEPVSAQAVPAGPSASDTDRGHPTRGARQCQPFTSTE